MIGPPNGPFALRVSRMRHGTMVMKCEAAEGTAFGLGWSERSATRIGRLSATVPRICSKGTGHSLNGTASSCPYADTAIKRSVSIFIRASVLLIQRKLRPLAAVVEIRSPVVTAPDHHPIAGPYGGVIETRARSVDRGQGSSPGVRGGIVLPACARDNRTRNQAS